MVGIRPIGRITADDLEYAFRALAVSPMAMHKYLQTCQHLQRWGVRRCYMVRPRFDADNRPVERAKPRKRACRLEPDGIGANGDLLPGEERRLLASTNAWMQRLIIVALETAMRQAPRDRRGCLKPLPDRQRSVRGSGTGADAPAPVHSLGQHRQFDRQGEGRQDLDDVGNGPVPAPPSEASGHLTPPLGSGTGSPAEADQPLPVLPGNLPEFAAAVHGEHACARIDAVEAHPKLAVVAQDSHLCLDAAIPFREAPQHPVGYGQGGRGVLGCEMHGVGRPWIGRCEASAANSVQPRDCISCSAAFDAFSSDAGNSWQTTTCAGSDSPFTRTTSCQPWA